MRIKKKIMFKKEQVENRINITEKRTYNAPFVLVPTSILITQTLARLKFQRVKKLKFSWRSREVFQFR